jgi:rhodanese-related sulfurtransferase
VALQLMEMGYTKVYALLGGWNEWKSKGYPVEAK